MVLFAVAACALFVCGGIVVPSYADSVYKALPASKVDTAKKEVAQKAATALLTAWNKGKFEPLPDTFTAQMIKDLTPEAQKAGFEKVKAVFGDFQSLTFVEAGTSPKAPGDVIYRFKGTFSKAKEQPEIRVIINDKGKISGCFILKWNAGL